MKYFAVFEAKNRFSELLAAVEHGKEITIPRHGAPVARLVAIGTKAQTSTAQRRRMSGAIQQLHALGSCMLLDCTLQQAIQDGRE